MMKVTRLMSLVFVYLCLWTFSSIAGALNFGGLFQDKISPSKFAKENNIRAAVLVPGFLTGADEFATLCQDLTNAGLPTVAVPMPNWHWVPCIGGRSVRPILERLDFTVQHLIANDGDINSIPKYDYNLIDMWKDFQTNPGGILEVGGSDVVDEYPQDVDPQGIFPMPYNVPQDGSSKKIALIGHSAGGWMARAYLSKRNYGGKIYNGHRFVHSLVTLGTPHMSAPGAPFQGVIWCNQDKKLDGIRSLAVGGTGFMGGEWGALTQGSYAFCCPNGTDGTSYDGDGVTPIQSALAMPGVSDTLTLDNVTHFCWSDVFGSSFVAPELTEDHKKGRPWYGSEGIMEKWADWIQ